MSDVIKHASLNKAELRTLMRQHKILFGGNAKLKIYGTLKCASGKRMKTENRVFFTSENEAIEQGYRPCGHCLKQNYLDWKLNKNKMQNI